MGLDYLFADSSFARGLGRVFDPFGTPEPYNWSRTPREADARAMYHDWAAVGWDISQAIRDFGAASSEQTELFEEPARR